jgi:hypothetical protein
MDGYAGKRRLAFTRQCNISFARKEKMPMPSRVRVAPAPPAQHKESLKIGAARPPHRRSPAVTLAA